MLDPIMAVIDPYWSQRNRLSWQGYDRAWTGMPFATMAAPAFACDLTWTPRQLLAFIKSWSAYIRAVDDGHGNRLARLEATALAHLPDRPRALTMPLHFVAARVTP